MGGGPKAVWNFSKNSSVLVGPSVPFIINITIATIIIIFMMFMFSRAKRIDVISRFIFPLLFAIFNLAYWLYYLLAKVITDKMMMTMRIMSHMMIMRMIILRMVMTMMMIMRITRHLVLFFQHFERMRLLVGHIYALQAVDVPEISGICDL